MPNEIFQSARKSSTIVLLALGASLIAMVPAQPALAQAAAPAAQAPAAPKLDKARIDALLATPDKVVFIDVRRADEISQLGGLPVFLNIQISELDRFLSYIPRDRQIVTVSNHAGRAQKAGRP